MSELWKKSDVWKRRGKNFLVEIKRHSEDFHIGDGPNRWCVYAYIYPKHSHFSKFVGPDMWQDAATILPLHAGPSFLQRHFNDLGDVMSVQVGCDYNHHGDDMYTYYETDTDARCIFNDADKLFNWLDTQRDQTP